MIIEKVSFDEIMKQNERRIHYYIHKLNLRDPHKEYYYEGLFAMWNAYETYQPDKGPLATYFNYTIRNRLVDQLRKEKRVADNDRRCIEEHKQGLENGNYCVRSEPAYPVLMVAESSSEIDYMLEEAGIVLSVNQRKWLRFYIEEGMSIKEIAEQEGVTCDAVKSWGREVRRKLQKINKGT